MTPKERFMACMAFQPVDHVPDMEICVWGQTRERWLAEDMPEDLNTAFMQLGEPRLGLEGYDTLSLNATGPIPAVEERVLDLQARKRAVIESTLGDDSSLSADITWDDVQELLGLAREA